jgi:hypothetical protein
LQLHEFDGAAFPVLGYDPKTASLTPLVCQCLFRVKRYRIGLSGHVRSSPGSNRIADIPDWQLRANFNREPPFLLRGLSYMREYHWNVPIVPRSELAAWMVAAVS